MTGLLEWAKKMIMLGIFLTVLLQVIPSETYRKYIRFFAGMIFVITILTPLFAVLGEKNWEQKLEHELLQEDLLQTGQMDFSYMERQQQNYKNQTKEVVVQMIRQIGEANDTPVQQVEVMFENDTGMISRVKVWTAVSGTESQGKLRKETADACGISENQVEVYET